MSRWERPKELAVSTMIVFVATAILLYPFTRPLAVAAWWHLGLILLFVLVVALRIYNPVEGATIVVICAILLALLIPAVQAARQRHIDRAGLKRVIAAGIHRIVRQR